MRKTYYAKIIKERGENMQDAKKEKIEYLFVFDIESKGWWLKIDSIEKLADYHEKTGSGKFDEAFSMYLNNGYPYEILEKLSVEERIKKMQDKDFKILLGAVMQAEKNELSILDGFRSLNMEIGLGQMRTIEEYGAIYINCVGGYTFGLNYNQFCRRKELVYPDFKESDIRIKQFQGGEHYYAYVGDMQVRDGENFKWNSYKEAYDKALEVIEKS